MENFEDLEVDESIFKKKKKINSTRKGKGAEREVCKILTARFNKPFSRSVGSGNRWGQVSNLPEHAKQTFAGDICCPEGFLWVFECKCGYENEIDLNGFDSGISRLDKFIKQSEHDAHLSQRKPIILWKRSRKNWLCMVETNNLPNLNYNYRIVYGNWSIVSFDDFLKSEDKYFFNI